MHGVSFRRGQRMIFDELSLVIPRGKVTAIMGPSGAGKTTLLKLITRQLLPDRGTITVAGQELAQLARPDLYALRKRIGILFQNGALLTDLSVFENVAFPLREHTRLPASIVRHIVLTKLHAVGLRGAAQMMPGELSGGMARRVALARAMTSATKATRHQNRLWLPLGDGGASDCRSCGRRRRRTTRRSSR
ncbi:MAG: ATP-binding cassette domain-containing protein, partial [Pseudomonadota bacterium]